MVVPVEFEPANKMSVAARHQPAPLRWLAVIEGLTWRPRRYTNGRPPDSSTAIVLERPSVTSLKVSCAFLGSMPFVVCVAEEVVEALPCTTYGEATAGNEGSTPSDAP